MGRSQQDSRLSCKGAEEYYLTVLGALDTWWKLGGKFGGKFGGKWRKVCVEMVHISTFPPTFLRGKFGGKLGESLGESLSSTVS